EDTASIKVMTYNIGVFRDYKVNSRTVTDVKKSLAKLVLFSCIKCASIFFNVSVSKYLSVLSFIESLTVRYKTTCKEARLD
ncbi:MAG: hypothetical protein II220_10485, partial [Spirochaetales bacterium]|nr:hypothetical protein [Spirochaetales bacterium]